MNQPSPATSTLPTPLYRAEQVRAFDRAAIEEHGIPGLELMNRAGAAAWAQARACWPEARTLCVLVGGGNNAGDGYVVARLAQADGCRVELFSLVEPERLQGDAAASCAAWRESGGSITPWSGELPQHTDLIVDALLGTGLERPLEGQWRTAVESINAMPAAVLALDLPSGLHADTGQLMGVAVRAALTVTFIGLKPGLFTGQGPEYCGRICVEDLEIPHSIRAQATPAAQRIDWAQQGSLLPRRARTANKGHAGHVLIIGGAPGMSGAVRLAGEAALRAGAGLVSIATHPTHAPLLNLTRPELMVYGIARPVDLVPLVAQADVVAIGPGLGRGDWGQAMWNQVCDEPRVQVVDADALNVLALVPMSCHGWVLTPHPGEAARLLSTTVADIEANRFASVRALQARFGGTLVLKGAGTLIQAAGEDTPAICSDGNPGMATAGSGDVLTGVIAALRAQGLSAADAARVGVCLHAAAGDQAARDGEHGLIASDLIAALRGVIQRAHAADADLSSY